MIELIIAILVMIWLYRIESNTAKTAESLGRIEDKLAEKGKR